MENFKDIPNYEGLYQVSDLGNVKSLRRCNNRGYLVKERILKPSNTGYGYSLVMLRKDGSTKAFTIHQLVAITFLNHTPCGLKLVVNHINNIRTDNRVENLEIISQRENTNRKHCKSISKYIGVTWHKPLNKWRACIYINKKTKHIGYFENEIDASNAYLNKLNELNQL